MWRRSRSAPRSGRTCSASAQSRPRRGAGPGYGPLRRPGRARHPPARGLSLPPGGARRRAGARHRTTAGTCASDGAAAFPPATAAGSWSRTPRIYGAARRRAALRPRRRDPTTPTGSSTGTTQNCAGGAHAVGHLAVVRGGTSDGRVWECDPAGRRRARAHAAMGVFKHEAAAVDPRGRRVYLTEDLDRRRRSTASRRERWPDLSRRAARARQGRRAAARWNGCGCRIHSAQRASAPAARCRAAREFARARGHLVRQRHALRGHHRRLPDPRLRHSPPSASR